MKIRIRSVRSGIAIIAGLVATPAWSQQAVAANTVAQQDHAGVQEAAQSGEAEPAQELEMFVGESRVFPARGVVRIAVGSAQVITANALDGKDIIVFANGPGTTMLYVWTGGSQHPDCLGVGYHGDQTLRH